jgi:Ran GTPase-activating protein (RanGAP) involved in mRNA processing and transport
MELKYFAEAIKVNSTIRKILLDNNKIGDEGAQYLAEAIKVNSELQHISLKYNLIDYPPQNHSLRLKNQISRRLVFHEFGVCSF